MRLAKIRGVDLKIHPSLLLMLGYIAMVASVQFPLVAQASGVDPTMLSGSPWVWGLGFAVALFTSVAMHEFGHVLIAQSLGVKVQGVTLMMLGGVSEMERLGANERAARTELKVSLAGPFVSFALAGALFALSSWERMPAEVVVLGYWLARANLVLAIFNLMPAFPLDGGRAFRAVLTPRVGMTCATEIAVRVARGFAWALGIFGFLGFNFILVLIAVFVYMAASSELALSVSRDLVKGVEVSEALVRTEPAHETETLRSIATRMLGLRRKVLAVRTQSGMPAILTLRDLYKVEPERWSLARASDAMVRAPRVLTVTTALDDILPELAAAGALPVEENGVLVGVIQYQDVVELLEFRKLGDPNGKKAA